MKDLTTSIEPALILSELNAGWRNVVAKAMGLDSNRFQMLQGAPGLQGGAGLLQVADLVAPQAGTACYDPACASRRSAYSELLRALRPQEGVTGPVESPARLLAAAAEVLENGAAAQINYNASTAPIASTGTVVAGSSPGFGQIFRSCGGENLRHCEQLAMENVITVTGRIGAYGTLMLPPAPGEDPGQISRAYNAKQDASVWLSGESAASWERFFGRGGPLARRVSQVLLVSDYDLTMTSKARFCTADVAQIEAAATGIWPFFGQCGSIRSLSHNSDGTLSLRYLLPKGQIEIWGVLLTAAPQ